MKSVLIVYQIALQRGAFILPTGEDDVGREEKQN